MEFQVKRGVRTEKTYDCIDLDTDIKERLSHSECRLKTKYLSWSDVCVVDEDRKEQNLAGMPTRVFTVYCNVLMHVCRWCVGGREAKEFFGMMHYNLNFTICICTILFDQQINCSIQGKVKD